MSKNNPIDIKLFKQLVTDNPGINRVRVMDLLSAPAACASTHKSRMDRAIKQAKQERWLFVQTCGSHHKLYTAGYAQLNNIRSRVFELPARDQEELGAIERCKLLNALWRPSAC